MGFVCAWWQRISSPSQQRTPCLAASPGEAVRQPTAMPPTPEQHDSLVPPQGYTSMQTQQQFARSAAEAPAARAASAELQRQHMPPQGAVGLAATQSRAGKRKHGCASCCWCAAGCEQCRADYGRGLAVSSRHRPSFARALSHAAASTHVRSCCNILLQQARLIAGFILSTVACLLLRSPGSHAAQQQSREAAHRSAHRTQMRLLASVPLPLQGARCGALGCL